MGGAGVLTAGAGLLAATTAAGPLMPTPLEMLLGWGSSLILGGLWVAGFVSLARSPLDARARAPWAVAMTILPVLGALVWFWWRHRYYPARLASQPAWDPNRRGAEPQPASSAPRTPAPTRLGAPDPYAGHAAPAGLLPRRRYGMDEFGPGPAAPRDGRAEAE